MKWAGLAALAVAGLLASGGAANAAYINLVQNWSFEQWDAPANAITGNPLDWDHTGNSYVAADFYNRVDAGTGHNFDFNGVGNSVSQAIETVVGEQYRLRFAVAARQDFGTSTVAWAFGDQSGTARAFGVDGIFGQPYYYYYFDLIADSASTLLSFTDISTGRIQHALLDSVEVLPPTSSVPEPAEWAMLMIGFGALGASLRRGRPHQRVVSAA